MVDAHAGQERRAPTTGCAPRAQPSRRLVQKWSVVASGSSSCSTSPRPSGVAAAPAGDGHDERRGVEEQRPPGPARERDEQAGDHRPDDRCRPRSSARAARWRAGGSPARPCREQAGERGGEERVRGAVRPRRARPACGDPRPVGDQQQARGQLAEQAGPTSEAIRIRLRSSRSAHTPAGSASTANGRNCAADTIATCATPPPTASTANGSTTAGDPVPEDGEHLAAEEQPVLRLVAQHRRQPRTPPRRSVGEGEVESPSRRPGVTAWRTGCATELRRNRAANRARHDARKERRGRGQR